MKVLSPGKVVLFIILLAAAPWFLNATYRQGPAIINFSDDDAGKTLTISKGRIFTITLPDHVDGGYRFDKAQYDTTILHLQQYVENPPAQNGRLGHSGTGLWEFNTLKRGKTAIMISASRPWKRTDTIIVFQSLFMVK